MHGGFDWDEMTKNWRVAVGTPERVAEKIAGWCEEADSSRVICHHHIGDMPHWKVVKNMTLFAEEVIPRLRPRKQAGPYGKLDLTAMQTGPCQVRATYMIRHRHDTRFHLASNGTRSRSTAPTSCCSSAGSGEPLVFLHGAGTACGLQLLRIVGAEASRSTCRIIPGFGESPDSAAITTIDDYVLHYLELLDHLGLDKVRLVGLSIGGWIAATLATQNSHRLKKLALVGPAGLRVRGASDRGHLPSQAGRVAGISRAGPQRARARCTRSPWSRLPRLSRQRLSRDVELCPTGLGTSLRPEARQVAAPD